MVRLRARAPSCCLDVSSSKLRGTATCKSYGSRLRKGCRGTPLIMARLACALPNKLPVVILLMKDYQVECLIA